MQVSIKRLSNDIPLPEYKTPGAVAFDLPAAEEVTIAPGEHKLIPTGLVIAVPEGHALILAPRSSSVKHGFNMANGIGVIDQDYCGPNDQLFVALRNFNKEPITIKRLERIAQGIILPIAHVTFQEVEDMEAADRGGFGTTGA